MKATASEDTSAAESANGLTSKHRRASLARLTVHLVPRAVKALEDASQATGDSRTDTINRALQVYALILDAAKDKTFYIENVDGNLDKFQLE